MLLKKAKLAQLSHGFFRLQDLLPEAYTPGEYLDALAFVENCPDILEIDLSHRGIKWFTYMFVDQATKEELSKALLVKWLDSLERGRKALSITAGVIVLISIVLPLTWL
jgi:hypothetical protein